MTSPHTVAQSHTPGARLSYETRPGGISDTSEVDVFVSTKP
jgi:hypothetical protein